MPTTPPTEAVDPADVRNESTGLTPREAAAQLHGGTNVNLTDPLWCGQAMLTASMHGAKEDDPVFQTMERWHARRQSAADAMAEAVRALLAGSATDLEPTRITVDAERCDAAQSALAAYDAARTAREGEGSKDGQA